MICYFIFAVVLTCVIVSWKNTLFLGVDACFKLKLKDRGFDDPDLSIGLAYMVKEGPYQTYLSTNGNLTEPVCLLVQSCGWLLIVTT